MLASDEAVSEQKHGVGGPRHHRRAPTVAEALKACARCTLRFRRGCEIECPECFKWVSLTRAGTIPRHRNSLSQGPEDPEHMIDADGRCFGSGHFIHRYWGRVKVLLFGGCEVYQSFDQYGNLAFQEYPYSLNECNLAGNRQRQSSTAEESHAGGQQQK
jgi:hypothetical protein